MNEESKRLRNKFLTLRKFFSAMPQDNKFTASLLKKKLKWHREQVDRILRELKEIGMIKVVGKEKNKVFMIKDRDGIKNLERKANDLYYNITISTLKELFNKNLDKKTTIKNLLIYLNKNIKNEKLKNSSISQLILTP